MNRHHYSLYVHNCRLVFLLRRDFTQVDTFRPAEFHWKLEQVRRPEHTRSSRVEPKVSVASRVCCDWSWNEEAAAWHSRQAWVSQLSTVSSKLSERHWVWTSAGRCRIAIGWWGSWANRSTWWSSTALGFVPNVFNEKNCVFNLLNTRYWLELSVYYKSLPCTQTFFVVFLCKWKKQQFKRRSAERKQRLSGSKKLCTFFVVEKNALCVSSCAWSPPLIKCLINSS